MARDFVLHSRNNPGRTKAKTGCATCRARKVKCDEKKPSCQRCISTGRICDGYESPFRFYTGRSINNALDNAGVVDTSHFEPQPILADKSTITPQDIELLSRCFSTKTMFDVKLECDDEARQLLQASLLNPSIRQAVSSLQAFRQNLETSGGSLASVAQPTLTSTCSQALQQYCMALGGVASSLSSPGSEELRSALLCCQVFISIEQVRGNYATMAQHIIRGLGILHECHARPYLGTAKRLMLAHHEHMPLLDVFIIKLFAAPCKFSEPPAAADAGGTSLPISSICLHQQSVVSRNYRAIAPNMRTEITRIAVSTLSFLDRVLRVNSADQALRLLVEKETLLSSLASWLIDIESVQTETKSPGSETLSVSFMRLFHSTMRLVILGALDSTTDLDAQLESENERLQSIANNVGERVKAYLS